MRSLKITRPTLSLLVIAENASTAASSAAEHVGADRPPGLRRHVAAALEERVRLRRQRQIQRRARRRAVLDEPIQIQLVRRGIARREDEVDDVLLDLVVEIDLIDEP